MKARHFVACHALVLLLCCASSYAQIQGNWRQIGAFGPVTITAVHFFNIEEGMVGYGTTIQYTTNGGKNWTKAKTPDLPKNAGEVRDFYFRDRWTGWAAFETGNLPTDISIPGVWKTVDGGATWVGIENSFQCNSVYVDAVDNIVYSTGKFAWESTQRGMMSRAHQSDSRFFQPEFWRTTNGGQTWRAIARKEETWGLYYQKSSKTYYCYPENSIPGQGTGLFKSNDFGDNWTFIDHSSSVSRNTGEIVGFDESIYIQGAGVYRSTDRGASFQFVGGPHMEFDVRMSVPPSCTGGVVVAPDQFGTLWITTDGGNGELASGSIEVDHPAQISTSTCTTPMITVPIENGNCMDVIIQSAVFETQANRFQLQPHDWPVTMKPDGADSIVIKFIPGTPPEKIQGRLRVKGIIKLPTGDVEYDRVFLIDGLTNFDALGLEMNIDSVKWGTRTNCVGCDTTITLTNLACDTMVVSSAKVNNDNFIIDQIDLPLSLAPGESRKISVGCDIAKRKAIKSTLTVIGKSGKFGVPDTVSIGLDAITKVALPDLQFLSDTIEFGNIRMCDPRDTAISLFNMGCDSFAVRLEDPNTAPFGISISSAEGLGSGDARVLSMSFTPVSAGEYRKMVRFIATRLGVEYPKDIFLHGFATSGISAPAFTSLNIDLDTINVCQSLTDTITLFNPSCESLSLMEYEIVGNPELTASTSTPLIAADSSGKIILHFDPQTEGLKSYQLHVRSTSGAIPFDTVITITAYVRAGERTIAQSTNALDLGEHSICVTPGNNITLTNNGCDTLTISEIDLQGSFILMGVGLPMKLGPGESNSIVVLSMLDTAGHKAMSTGTLAFKTNADNSLPPIALSRSYSYPRSIGLTLSMATPAIAHNSESVSMTLSSTGDMSDIQQIEFDLVYDADLLSNLSLTNGSIISSLPEGNGLSRQRIRLSEPFASELVTMSFVTRLAIGGETPITVEKIKLNDFDPQFENCVATAGTEDTSRFSYLYDCSERSLQEFLRSGNLPIRIISMRPNPVDDKLTIEVDARDEVNVQLLDMQGKLVRSIAGDRIIEIDTKQLSSGLYFVRISAVGESVVRSLIKR